MSSSPSHAGVGHGADWDVVVIGAGPAGSIAARECVRRGANVLLVDKVGFPRWKVCGSCLNASALGVLGRVGLASLPESLGARPIERISLVSRTGARAELPMRGGVSVSRWALDEALANAAADAGCCLRLGAAATVGHLDGDARFVRVGDGHVRAKVVIVADGLAGTALRELREFKADVASTSRVGVGCLLDAAPSWCERGSITMVCGRRGYVGAVWLEDDRVDVAAAVDAGWIKERGGPGPAVAAILAEAGLPHDDLMRAAWRGTSHLTRRRRVEGERLLVIGDAAGYVEPFTGEGMAWAMMTGEAAGATAVQSVLRGQSRSWTMTYRSLVGVRQRECRGIARVLRHSGVIAAAISVLGAAPALAGPIVQRINGHGGRKVVHA